MKMKCFGAFWHYFENLSRLLGEARSVPTPMATLVALLEQLHRVNLIGYNSVIIFHMLQVRNGHIKRITDGDIQSLVLELMSTNVR